MSNGGLPVRIYDTKGRWFVVDEEDYPAVSAYTWSITNKGYWRSRKLNITIHRFLIGVVPEGMVVDHINGNKSDNRRVNLRVVTPHQNAMNNGISKANTTGKTGVYYRKDRNKWKAGVCYKRKQIWYPKLFDSYEEAVIARNMLEDKYFGEFARRKTHG